MGMTKTERGVLRPAATRVDVEQRLTGKAPEEGFKFLIYTTAGTADFLMEESARLLGKPDRNWLVNAVLTEWIARVKEEREMRLAEALKATKVE